MRSFQVLVLLLSALVLTEGQNQEGMPPDFNGRRIPYDLFVFFGNEQNATTTVSTTTSTKGTETPAGSSSPLGDSTTTVETSTSNETLNAEASNITTTPSASTQPPTTTTPVITSPVVTTIPTTSETPTTNPPSPTTDGSTATPTTITPAIGTGTVTTTSPSSPGSNTGLPESTQMLTGSTTRSSDTTTTSAQPEMTTSPVTTPDLEEIRKNLTQQLIPIYQSMPGFDSVQALAVIEQNARARSTGSPKYSCPYRLELVASTVTNCLANNACNITEQLIIRMNEVARLSLGGYPVHQPSTEALFNTFLNQESSKSLGTACQAGQPCLSYGPKYTCRLNQTAGAVSCHDVCTESNYCEGGTCLSNNVENGTKTCRCPGQTVHNGSTCLNWWIVIGPSIGGAALLLIMIFVVIGLVVKLGRTDQKSSLKPSPSFTDSLRRYEMVGGQDNRAYTPDPTSQDAASPQTFKYETPGTTPGASVPGPTEAATLPLAERGQPQDKAPANGVANGRSSLEMQDYPYQPSGAPPSRTYAQEVEDIMQSEAAKNFYPKLDHIDPKQDYSIRRPQLNTGTSYGDQVARF